MKTSEKELVQQAKDGDRRALADLLERVQPQLYRFSMRMCRHKEDAEDVLQESMLALSNSVSEFRGASSLSTWLFTVARRFCIKKRAKSTKTPGAVENMETLEGAPSRGIQDESSSPEREADRRELSQRLEWAIRSLEPKYREVFLLRDGEGMTAPEVSEVLGISIAAVKSRLHRARKDLRTELSGPSGRRNPECPNIIQMLSRHLEGELTSDVCARMELHVSECSSCNRECEDLKQALNLCRNASCDVPFEVQQRVRDSLQRAMKMGT